MSSAVICLVVADNAPAVLDASLQPLEPVLRSNYWLTIHVMTITVSYSAFLLAFILGDIGLVYVLKDENKFKDHIEKISLVIYRSIQIGVVLLFPGIVLGVLLTSGELGLPLPTAFLAVILKS